MPVEIIFITYGSNTAMGNFGPGDRARCGSAQARHLVDEVRCAKYAQIDKPAKPAKAESVSKARRQVRSALALQEP